MQDLYLLKEIHEELGIQERHLADNKLASCEQPFYTTLEVVEIDYEGKAFVLNKPAAQAWR
ncbi:MAG: hypothetical protein NTV34_17315, partial [Proteobacteria bacterium]|nr:hypothetical protein [Pseudomonadota bacterium]